jgi:hypothetical protein
MERQFEDMNEQYFKGLLGHHDSVVHTRAVSESLQTLPAKTLSGRYGMC